ncbi:MAG TPA: CoA transferase [Chloroflexota bacterium]|nr:CoA transferase [Chloroflexota bacterium]
MQSSPEPGRPEGALTGYRVLDLTGPLGVYCAKLLGDLGADVVRVEPPTGDPLRQHPPFYRAPDGSELSLYYLHMNTSKRAVSLDLAQPRGRELFLRLVERADVVVESFAPSYLPSLGLGYPDLRARNPRLVVTSITPFGQSGPYAEYAASDLIGQAMGGVLALTGYADGTPLRLACDQGYHCASVHACAGTLIALYHREATGEGQQVDASMQEALALAMQPATQYWDEKGQRQGHHNLRFGSTTPCKDGHVAVALGRAQAFERVATWLAEEGVFEDQDGARWDDPAWQAAARPRVQQALRTFLMRHTKAELIEEAQRRGIWLSPVYTAEDVTADPQLAARGFFQPVEYPELGVTLTHLGGPFVMSESPWRIAHRAPLHGEHNRAIYGEDLGLSERELDALHHEGVI